MNTPPPPQSQDPPSQDSPAQDTASSAEQASTTYEKPPATGAAPNPNAVGALRLRYRIRFAKTGLLRWTSHRDLAMLWERLVRRAQLKLSMSEGFHPKPRIGFPSALALGISGAQEVVELDLAERLSASELLERLSKDDQPGLEIKSVQLLPDGGGKAKLLRSEFVITTPDPELGAAPLNVSALNDAIAAFLAEPTVTVTRKNKPLTVSVADQVLQLTLALASPTEQAIHLSLAASDAATLKPTDVLDLIGCSDWIEHGSQITRTEVVLKQEFETADPELFATAHPSPPMGEPTDEVPQ